MLFLDRIEILGFKSFFEKTTLKIPAGITSIVGPNGCGKSNVVDALNWVLGEQSAKTLRSEKMEEIIFNGSKNRKPVNLAQVNLVWKTEKDNPAAPEVTITRRLIRSGESQYEMNGDLCRLKDIHLFFLNEGFDPLAYSILEQGKIDFLFISKPSERRVLIEEVAGVAEFRHKKRSAQLKLAENQIQLERIQDILSEVEKQLSSLKRQAAKTRRFQLLKEEKGIIQQIFFHRRYAQILEENIKLGALLSEQMELEQNAGRLLQEQDLVCSEMKLRLKEMESKIYQDQDVLHHLEIQLQDNQNSLASKRQRMEELLRIVQDKQLTIEKLGEEEVRIRSDHQAKTDEEALLKNETEDLTRQHTSLFADLEQKANEVSLMENQLQETRKEILELLSNASQLRNEQTRLHTQQEHLLEDIHRKEMEWKRTTESHSALLDHAKGKQGTLAQIQQEIGYLDLTKEEILRNCEQLKVEWDALQHKVQIAFKRQSDLQHELQKLDAQQHSSKFYNESARNLLTRPTKQALGVLMDFVETSPQYETAIENFLADKLNYLIVNEANMALDSIDYLKQEGLGYCGFVIQNGHDTTPPVLPETLRQEPGVIASLREVVQIREEALPAVAPFMKSAVLVESLANAQGLIQQYPDYQFVTVQGDVILSPTLYAGGAKTEDVPGLMAIQRHRKELDSELEIVNHQLQGLEEQVRTIQERLDVSNHEMVRITEVRESKNKDLLMEQMSADQIEKERAREEKVVEILSQEIAQLSNEKEAVAARFEEFTRQLEEETTRRQEREQAFQEMESNQAQYKDEQQQYQTRVQESRVQIAELKERDRSLLADLERLNRDLEEVSNAIADSVRVIEERQNEIHGTRSDCSQIEALLVEMLRNRDAQKGLIEEAQQKKEILGNEITEQENRVREAQAALDFAREERSNTEITKTRTETQKEDLLARCREEMGIELESLSLPESDMNQLGDDDLKNKLAETEMKIDRLGSINALALEEYVQLEERHRFLKTQYDDLKVSIDTLLETIQRIDVTSLQRFREAFVKVQTHFQDLFQRLFNGGKCEMVLVDPENPSESGIDIHVQPPGKKLQNMNLLSGGEKTLTGVAFLMALFQYHASPICVMDEVDAALDEVNVQRFAALIAEMKKQIQFIIVTHNKRTMEAADQLYGVTMSEPGVSSVLSAKFDEAEALIAS